jgi:Coenzyme A transferase
MTPPTDGRMQIVLRAALEIHDGVNVNLGIGPPTLLAEHTFHKQHVMLHSENGLLGIGPLSEGGHGRPRSDQRGQRDGHRRARRLVLRQRGVVRDDRRLDLPQKRQQLVWAANHTLHHHLAEA